MEAKTIDRDSLFECVSLDDIKLLDHHAVRREEWRDNRYYYYGKSQLSDDAFKIFVPLSSRFEQFRKVCLLNIHLLKRSWGDNQKYIGLQRRQISHICLGIAVTDFLLFSCHGSTLN